MVACLLELRLVTLRGEFEASQYRAVSLTVAWATLRDEFARRQPPEGEVNVLQLKNKWHLLRKEYASILRREQEQAPDIEYPRYFPTLAAHFRASPEFIQLPENSSSNNQLMVSPAHSAPAAGGTEPSAVAEPEMSTRAASPSQTSQSLSQKRAAATGSRRGHHAVADSRRRVRWTLAMITTLLELRLGVLRELFKRSRSSAQRCVAWEQLGTRFRFQLRAAPLDVLQLKNKYNALRKEYIVLAQASRQQQAGVADSVEFPEYWETLRHYCAGVVPVPEDLSGPAAEQPQQHELVEANGERGEATSPGEPQEAAGSARLTAIQPRRSDSVNAEPPAHALESASSSKGRRLQWDSGMVASLLELRLGLLGAAFEASSGSSAQLRELWRRLRLKFALQHNLNVDVLQLKNKYNSLRKEYLTTAAAILEHQESDGKPPALPLYWPALLFYFSEKQDAQGVVRESAMDRGVPSRKRQLEDDAASRNTWRRAGSAELHGESPEDSLAALSAASVAVNNQQGGAEEGSADTTMETLVKLVQSQTAQQQAMQRLLAQQQEQLERMAAESAAVNAALFQFLQARRAAVRPSSTPSASTTSINSSSSILTAAEKSQSASAASLERLG
ncbi:hypothetical protein BBJ28_00008139 [Nothophytophthora sp. Chile5]|nr:hypothetical protein BBJ28_00008139 [Nothophytophthora sp. Chile5]